MIGEKLRQLRSEEGNTQMELAKAVDVSVKTVKNWESDINDPDLIHAIAIVLLSKDTLDTLFSYLSQKRKKLIKEVVFFKTGAESFSPNERKEIRDELKLHEINVRCVFIQKTDFTHIRVYGWRKEFFRIVGISRKSIW